MKKDNAYKWNEENTKVTEKIASHLGHNLNNRLAILMAKLNSAARKTDDPEIKEILTKAQDQADKIHKYVKYFDRCAESGKSLISEEEYS